MGPTELSDQALYRHEREEDDSSDLSSFEDLSSVSDITLSHDDIDNLDPEIRNRIELEIQNLMGGQ